MSESFTLLLALLDFQNCHSYEIYKENIDNVNNAPKGCDNFKS